MHFMSETIAYAASRGVLFAPILVPVSGVINEGGANRNLCLPSTLYYTRVYYNEEGCNEWHTQQKTNKSS
jgi:hypothetical protein